MEQTPPTPPPYTPPGSTSASRKNLIERIKNILLAPQKEWQAINGESATLSSLITSYTIVVAGVGALGIFIGLFLIGIHGFTLSFKFSILTALIAFVSSVVTVIVAAFVADNIASSMGVEKNMNKSSQWVAYGLTPACLAWFIAIVPGANTDWIVYIVGFGYSFYLLYVGAPIIKKTAQDKTIPYVAVTTGASLLVMILVIKILGKILIKTLY